MGSCRDRTRCAYLLLLIGVMTLALGGGAQVAAAHWQPRPTTKPWQWQLQGKIDTSIDVPVFDVDGFETQAGTVRRLHRLRSHGAGSDQGLCSGRRRHGET